MSPGRQDHSQSRTTPIRGASHYIPWTFHASCQPPKWAAQPSWAFRWLQVQWALTAISWETLSYDTSIKLLSNPWPTETMRDHKFYCSFKPLDLLHSNRLQMHCLQIRVCVDIIARAIAAVFLPGQDELGNKSKRWKVSRSLMTSLD